MLVQLISFSLLTLWIGLGALGIAMLAQRRWLAGAVLLGEALLALAAQILLSTYPVGIGEPLIRIPSRDLIAAGAAALIVVAVIAAITLIRRVVPRFSRAALVAAGLLTPVLAASALWGLSYLSTPERERERDPDKRAIVLPPGFKAEIYARGMIDNPTVITFGPDGKLYIADISGALWVAEDTDNDHVTDAINKIEGGYELLLGLLWHKDELFVASSGKIEALTLAEDGKASGRRTVASNLPTMIYKPHSNNSITLGPDGRIYFGVGSTVASGVEPNPLASAILSVSPDGGDVTVHARGFGNPFEMAFNARGDMFTGDNPPIAPDGESAPDELNHVIEGGEYGFESNDFLNNTARDPLVTFPPHSTPTGLTFYTGNTYPPEYFDNAFMALWTRGEVARIALTQDARGNYRADATVFASGLLYPIDVINGPDGNLYIADFGTSVIYRVTYEGQ